MNELPEDLTAEEAVIGTCLIDPQMFVAVRPQLPENVWTRDEHREIWSAMCRLNDRGEKVSFLSVAGECEKTRPLPDRGWALAVSRFLNAEGVFAHDLAGAVRRVRFIGVQRRAIQAAAEIAGVAIRGSAEDEPSLIAKLTGIFTDRISPDESTLSIVRPEDLTVAHYELLTKRKDKSPEFIGWKTGIADLDRVAALRSGELWYIAAAPGVGKTAFMLGIADSLAKRRVPVLFASVEQPRMQLMDRLVAADTDIDSWRIGQGELSISDFQRVSDALSDRRTNPLYVIDDGSLTTASLAAAVQLSVVRYGVRIVFVDYVQLLTDAHGDTENARVGYISRRLREIARTYNVCLVAASQLSRGYSQRADEMPRLTDLRESGRLEQDAFVVLALRRNLTEKPREAQMKVLKNRNGRADLLIELDFDPQRTRFMSVAREAA